MAQSVLIKRAEPADSKSIAALHCNQISWGLLSELGEGFVEAFYRALICSRSGFGFLAEQDGRVIGFVSGVVDWRQFYREFLRRHVRLVVLVLSASLRRGRWRRLLETTRYAALAVLPPAEFVSMALEPDVRGKGIAGEMVRRLLEEFAARGIGAVRVTTGGANVRASRVFEKMGFTFHSETEIHPGERAAIYVIALDTAVRHQTVPS